MNLDKLACLLQEYFDNTISKTDCIELLKYLNESENDIADVIKEEMLGLQDGPSFSELRKNDVLKRIKADPRFTTEQFEPHGDQPKIVKFYQKTWLKVVAAILFVTMGYGLYVVNSKNKDSTVNTVQNQTNMSIEPAGTKITLTLSSGKVIVLDSTNHGFISNVGKTRVYISKKAQISENNSAKCIFSKAKNNRATYNILSTPNGGMSDVTKVWLNSASSIKFPAEFKGNQRKGIRTGEAYFEAAINKDKSFFVEVKNIEVRVLTTHFNSTTYEDYDAIIYNMLEGSLQLKQDNQLSLIKPGEQAKVDNNADIIKIELVNI